MQQASGTTTKPSSVLPPAQLQWAPLALPCPLEVEGCVAVPVHPFAKVLPPHCIPGGQGDGHMPLDGHQGGACWGGCCQVLQLELDVVIPPLSVAASLD
ncbi:hypothetical protein HaLaN_08485 [Haematococcus lacustris]|uniref:Uncharacterized protein n=1 Tax=Haematococcus lacustris TaxID=44745 RepID=A0A699ZB93_HAELA|nr:hypothetical protein HaLaN_08485 [Haematococcus lacustris]